jgi:hypothetical protein
MQLIVFMEPAERVAFQNSGFFCCRPEENAAKLKAICAAEVLPYPEPFVSIAVLHDDELPCDSHAHIYGLAAELSALHFAILKTSDDVLNSIELVSNNDLKQRMNEMADRRRRHQPYGSLRKHVRDLRTLSTEQKFKEILGLSGVRGSHGYTEARLNRKLTLDDVVDWGTCDGLGVETAEPTPGADIPGFFL